MLLHCLSLTYPQVSRQASHPWTHSHTLVTPSYNRSQWISEFSHTEAGQEQLSLRDTTFNTTAGSFRSCVHTQTSGLSFYPFTHRRDKRYKSRCWDPLLRGMGANEIPFPPVGRGKAVKRGPSYFRPAVPRSYFSIRFSLYI